MFGPWLEIYAYLRTLPPEFKGFKFRIPHLHFTFIFLHYAYIVTLTLIGSVIIYGSKNLAYIDALFFSSGSATQSGLNTINVNDIELYQQVTLMLIACIANPIFVNTTVVFIRLYWFEKRFQHVVLEAQRFRRTRDRSRSRGKADDMPNHDREERGVGNRKIVVLHPGERTMDLAAHESPLKHASNTEAEAASSDDSVRDASTSVTPPASDSAKTADEMMDGLFDAKKDDKEHNIDEATIVSPTRRNIMFADEVSPTTKTTMDSFSPISAQMTPDQHITFLEKQRNPKDKKTLYIPGPRDFDRGEEPEEIDGDKEVVKVRRKSTAGQQTPSHRTSMDVQPHDDSAMWTRKSLAKRLSFEDATTAFNKAKHGVRAAFRPFQGDGPAEDASVTEKLPDLHGTSTTEVADHAPSLRRRGRARTFASFMTSQNVGEVDPLPYLSYQATIGRNSAFVNLSEEQREELGGIEYRALKTLAFTLVCYFVGFHILGVLCLLPYILRNAHQSSILRADGVSPVWWGIFTPASMFNDLGITLTPDSMNSFQYAVWPLLIGSYLVVIGNTGFPCMLRFVIYVASKCVPHGSSIWEEFRFLLDHPRRCFTLLFPSTATWWLFWVLVFLNGLDLVFFVVLDLGDDTVSILPPGIRVLDGFFQAVSTRTAGFSVVNLANLHPGVQVSYLIMMYISVFPIAISVRRTNVYEEKSLGVYATKEEAEEDSGTQNYIGNHLRRQLSFDLWYVFLGLLVICIVEGTRLSNHNQYAFTVFSVLFEVVSAYGTVGLSLGYPGTDPSFSSQFHTLSKLVIIAMQIRGRHRGLPYALDKAILLPGEEQTKRETELVERTNSSREASTIPRNATIAGDGDATIAADRAEQGLAMSSNDLGRAMSREPSRTSRTSTSRRKSGGAMRLLGQALGVGPAKYD